MAIMKGKIEYEVHDENNKLIQKGKQPVRSLVANFASLLQNTFIAHWDSTTSYSVPTITLNDVTNTGQTITTTVQTYVGTNTTVDVPFSVNAFSGDSSYGVVIGYGSVTPTPTDIKLANQFLQGSGANQFNHGATTVEAVTTTTTNSSFRVSRTFTNSYTAQQTVTECGLYVKHIERNNLFVTNQDRTAIFCIAHDSLSPSVNVPAGSTLTLRYVFTFPV